MKPHLMLLIAAIALSGVNQRTFAQTLLAVDVNDRTAFDTPNTVPGFLSYTMSGTQTVGSYSVTLAPFDDHLDQNTVTEGIQDTVGAIDDRDRTLPTDGGLLTYAQLYDDLIFAGGSTGPSGGMDLTISGGTLLPNTQYLFSIYAYDSESKLDPQPRTANWLDGNNADALVLATAFRGNTAPVDNDDYRFTGVVTTDETGEIFLKGRSTTGYTPAGGVEPGVFINGFEINPIPEPSTVCLTLIGLASLIGIRRRK